MLKSPQNSCEVQQRLGVGRIRHCWPAGRSVRRSVGLSVGLSVDRPSHRLSLFLRMSTSSDSGNKYQRMISSSWFCVCGRLGCCCCCCYYNHFVTYSLKVWHCLEPVLFKFSHRASPLEFSLLQPSAQHSYLRRGGAATRRQLSITLPVIRPLGCHLMAWRSAKK